MTLFSGSARADSADETRNPGVRQVDPTCNGRTPMGATHWFVWKYVLDLDAECTRVQMPSMARFLSLQVQDGQPVMWWDVVPTARQETRTFYVVPTGMPGHTTDLHYVGTFQLGRFVGHVFTDEPFKGAAR